MPSYSGASGKRGCELVARAQRGRQELAARYLRLPNTKIAQKPHESRPKPYQSRIEPFTDLR